MKDYIQGSTILLHGVAKAGKTQFCATFPKPLLFYAAEPGHRYVENLEGITIYRVYTEKDWVPFLKHIESNLVASNYKTIVVDTTNTLYLLCQRYICQKNGVEYPSDLPHGKGWALVSNEFMKAISNLSAKAEQLNATVVFVTHTQTETLEYRTCTISRQSYILGGQPDRIIAANVDNIWFMDFPTDIEREMCPYRVLWLKGNTNVRAESRDPNLKVSRIKKLLPNQGYAQVNKAFAVSYKKKE